ncbi:hypothetical protein BJX63DRAFT_412059 [Aspergillus granulosus]|uniref:Calcofluor white hypersensitive protein n=1 Tax=Aspergillus granulosus TaxID=176169 RepID=A0ABR4GWC6_9EURO
MAAPARSRTGLYLGVGAVGIGAYYLYQAGGNPRAAKEGIKYDANKARGQAPGGLQGERAGETAGLETNLNIDEAANNPRTQNKDLTAQAQRKLDEVSQAGKEQASKLRGEVEEKTSEAKSTVSGWFGGKK